MPARYFVNRCLSSIPNAGQPISAEWIQQTIAAIVPPLSAARQTKDDCDGGIYVGLSGIAYGLWYAAGQLPNEQRTPVLAEARTLSEFHMKNRSNKRDEESMFLLGNAGLYAVSALIRSAMDDAEGSRQMVERYAACADSILPLDYLPKGGDEILVGRAGYLFGLLNLRLKLNTAVISDDKLRAVLKSVVDSGRAYAKKRRFKCPLMYSYHGAEYLGAAHGLAGILQSLISFPEQLHTVDAEAFNDVRASVDWLLGLQTANGNFPPAVDDIGTAPNDDELVHWCHGAPGVVQLLARAFLVWKDAKYLAACRSCCELIWQKGLLKKGPGVCHGVAGNGYAFLLLYQLTGEEMYLDRARVFAEFLDTQEFVNGARTPDAPLSLYEGWAGTLCYFADLSQPSKAEFPLFPVIF
uniref:LanC-like protein 3 homolog n=1 Tax=Plectus sambesii TaxID=2011161 RepID=A0A914XB79_9BILA